MIKVKKTHREMYPEQYTHELVGKKVNIIVRNKVTHTGIVERVVNTRFGFLCTLENEPMVSFAIKDAVIIK